MNEDRRLIGTIVSEKLQRIYRAFATKPLGAGDEDLYVDLTPERGDSNVVQRLAREIRLSSEPVCKLLAGHDGSGKSTELRRLQAELQKSCDDRFFVVYCEADNDIDRNDVDFPEILTAIIRQTACQLKERAEISLKPGYFSDRFDRLKKLLMSEVDFNAMEIDAAFGSITTRIKSGPDARLEIRKLLEPDTANWLHAANKLLADAHQELNKKGYKGLVVIVDDLDKMVLRSHESAGCSTQEYLFVHRAAQLRAFACNIIYTMPIELAYSHLEQSIASLYGGRIPVIPMTKIMTKPPRSTPHKPGVELFREIIATRLESVGASNGELFRDDNVSEELIRLSGGQPTALMTLVREAIVTKGLPITPASLERLTNEGRRTYARQFRADHWPILEEVRKSGAITRTKENDVAIRELLESRAVLLYLNEDEWYGLNPLAEGLPPPAKPKKIR